MDPIRDAIVQNFTEEERVHFLAVLFRVARADEVSPTERDRLLPVTEWMKATPEELADAIGKADDASVPVRDLVSGLEIGDSGVLLFREACAVAWVDGRKSVGESTILEQLAQALGIADGAREILDSPLACSPEGERRFLALLGGTS